MRCLAAIVQCAFVGVVLAQPNAVDFDVTGEYTGAFTRTALFEGQEPSIRHRQMRDGGASSSSGGGGSAQSAASSSRLFFYDGLDFGAERTNTAAFAFDSSVSAGSISSSLISIHSVNQGRLSFTVNEPGVVSIHATWAGTESMGGASAIASGQLSLITGDANGLVFDVLDFSGADEQSVSWDLLYEDFGVIDMDFYTSALVVPGSDGSDGTAFAGLDIVVEVSQIPSPGAAATLIPGLLLTARRRR